MIFFLKNNFPFLNQIYYKNYKKITVKIFGDRMQDLIADLETFSRVT